MIEFTQQQKLILLFFLVWLVVGLAIGFLIGQYTTDKTWQSYHKEYRDAIIAHHGYDPENPNNALKDTLIDLNFSDNP